MPPVEEMAKKVAAAAAAMQVASGQIDDMSDCIGQDVKNPVKTFAEAAKKMGSDSAEAFAAHKAFVSKPMPGSGKCDGGFEAVAAESGKRAEDAAATQKKLGEVMHDFIVATKKNLEDTELPIQGSKPQKECAKKAAKLLDALIDNSKQAFGALGNGVWGLHEEELSFREYQAKNEGLQKNCGAKDASLNKVATGNGGNGGAKVDGKSGPGKKDGSTITGVEEDKKKQDGSSGHTD